MDAPDSILAHLDAFRAETLQRLAGLNQAQLSARGEHASFHHRQIAALLAQNTAGAGA